MDLAPILLESWTRQCRILDAIASRIDETTRKALPTPDGWPIDEQLTHVIGVRGYWLSQVAPEFAQGFPPAPWAEGGDWGATASLDQIRAELTRSGKVVGEAVRDLLDRGVGAVGGYDHPVLFLQHMVWHEGWHVGLIVTALRVSGHELPEPWEEEHVWGEWRKE